MNALIVDCGGPDRTCLGTARRLTGADPVALLRTPADGPVSVRFGTGEEVIARLPGAGSLCGAMLTADRFDWAGELIVLTGPAHRWATHLDRLADDRPATADAFFSFDPHDLAGAAGLTGVPLLDLSAAAAPALIWLRRTSDFFDLAQSAVRKDARVAGRFGFGSLVRELLLTQANVAFQTEDRCPIQAPIRAAELFLAAA